MFKKPRVYLDYAAATPLSPAAFSAMKPWLLDSYANASAIHAEGLAARQAVEAAREQVADVVKVRPEYVTFVSGGTEANNLGLFGTVEYLKNQGRTYESMEVITTAIEHPSITEAMKELTSKGVKVLTVNVNSEGKIDRNHLQSLLAPQTVLVAFAYANSEIGTIQPVRALRRVMDEAEKSFSTKIFLLLDAAQAPLWLQCQANALQADLIAFDAGKCNGPKGVGFLVTSRRVKLAPILFGGGQESGLRPGTENVAGIVGASVAFAEAQANYKERVEKVSAVRDAGMKVLQDIVEGVVINGTVGDDRLANNINISLPGLDTEFATVVLDKHGFAVSTKSACAGAGGGESVVVKTISGDPVSATSTLRISLSPETKLVDIKRLAIVLKNYQEQMKSLTSY